MSLFKQRNFSLNINEDEITTRLLTNNYSISFNSQLKRSKRDIRSKWGYGFSASFRHSPFEREFNLQQFGTQAYLLFPGLAKHHSILARGGVQLEPSIETLSFSSSIQYPRGYIYSPFETLYTGSAEYALPLWYPDFHIGKLVNFQRFKTNLFYDFGVGMNNDLNNYFNSVGLDFTADLNVFRLLPLLEVGIRTAYVPELNNFRYDLILNYIGY